jgi:hypothetical protein
MTILADASLALVALFAFRGVLALIDDRREIRRRRCCRRVEASIHEPDGCSRERLR